MLTTTTFEAKWSSSTLVWSVPALLEKESYTMNVQVQPNLRTAERRLPFECVALVLQGGGALGAYQAGIYESLAEGGIHPDWVAGVSVGAINGAIIAGNPPTCRIERLREFWMQATAGGFWPCFG